MGLKVGGVSVGVEKFFLSFIYSSNTKIFTMAFLGELEIRFFSFSNHRKETLESCLGNVLKEFETFIFYENLLKIAGCIAMHLQSSHFESKILELSFNISCR